MPPGHPSEGVATAFRLRCPEARSGSSVDGVEAFDVPESGISLRLGLTSGLGVCLTPRLNGSVTFRRIELREWAPEVPLTSGSEVLNGVGTSASTAGKFPICRGEEKSGVLTISSGDALAPVFVYEGLPASGVWKNTIFIIMGDWTSPNLIHVVG